MPDPTPPLKFDRADDLLAALWKRLASKPFRTQSLATIGAEGSPRVRSVIVREVDVDARAIACHADRGSAKIAELRRDPRAAWCGWDAGEKLQIRVASSVTVHLDDAVADEMWRTQSASNLLVYRVVRPAGATIATPEDAGRQPTADRSRFAVLRASVTAIEWLSLADAEQHRRGRFTFADRGVAEHHFLVP